MALTKKILLPQKQADANIAAVSAQNNLSEFDLFNEKLAAGWERIIGSLIALILALVTSVEEFEISKKV